MVILKFLARMFHELLTTITDMAILPCVLGRWPLRRTTQVRLGFDFGSRISDFAICSLVLTSF